MSATDAASCPSWCEGGHGPRFAHKSRPAHVFGVITALHMHQGKPTATLHLDASPKAGVTLDRDELDRVIAHLTTCRDRLNAAREAQ